VPQLGLGSSLRKPGGVGRTYVKDGLKLYMPYRGSDASEVDFVGTGSTSFDATGDYINCGTALATAIGDNYDGGFSVCMWFKANTTSSDDGLFSIGNSNIFYFRFGDSVSSQFAFTDAGVWHHIAGVFDGVGNYQYLYLDGVLKDSDAQTDDLDMDGLNTMIGGYYSTSYLFDGSIKNVAVWSRALTATEIQNVMYKTYIEVSGRLGDSTSQEP
jgi:hypothetical protein